MLAGMAPVGAQKMAAGLIASSHHQEEFPLQVPQPPYLEVDGNFLVQPMDVLQLINHLNYILLDA